MGDKLGGVLLFLICIFKSNKGDHMFYEAPDEHNTRPRMLGSRHNCYIHAHAHIRYTHTHTHTHACMLNHITWVSVCPFTLIHRKKRARTPTPSRAESFYANNGYSHVCYYATAIMHNSTQREQAGWYSRPYFRWTNCMCMNIVVCVCACVCLRHFKGDEQNDNIHSIYSRRL